MEEGLPYRDENDEARLAALDGSGGQKLGVARQLGDAIDAQRLVDAGNEEQQTDLGIRDDVRQRIQPVVAGPVRDDDGVVVQHPGKARRVAARAHIGAAPGRVEPMTTNGECARKLRQWASSRSSCLRTASPIGCL